MRKISLLLITIVFFYSRLSLIACEQEKKQITENKLPSNIYILIDDWEPEIEQGMKVSQVANIRELNRFLANKNNLEARDEYGSTLLIRTSQVWGEQDLVKHLLKLGADVNAVNKLGKTALWYAVYHRSPEMVRALLDYHANIDQDTINHAETMFIGQKNRSVEEFEEYKFKRWQEILNLLQYYPDYLEKRKQGELRDILFDDYVLARKTGEELKQRQYLPDVLNQEIIEYITGPRKARDKVD